MAQTQARFVRHEGCEKCGSRDNVGIWDDGSKFCFGCHWYKLPEDVDRIRQFAAHRALQETEPTNTLGEPLVKLPFDYSMEIPIGPYRWLDTYLNAQEVLNNQIGYSKTMERIIFPIYDLKYKLVLWTARAKDGGVPKWYTQGRKNDITHFIHSDHDPQALLVLTEDIVSAIKVSRVSSAMPLFGTTMPLEHATKLSKQFKHIVIWLDSDMKRKSLEMALKLEPWFQSVKVVFSEKDPKEYPTSEIRRFLSK